ncbi:hypothetical protein F2P56_035501 [Juglans regia]|uniref:Integrase catalytic domain-containing protein n=2 Tax=Juglans regia TaxID=51240 RepID=A0A833TWS1_JUGRE|nr:uncharacterized protein K02A2.6-like [Juglans regia]KAF5442889.1 hypothetical protein F2P56_035501 [Juglans regia]
MPPSKGGTKFVVDYFTKRAKAEAMTIVPAKSVTRFIWKAIVCRFGILQSIISNNGKQFDSKHYCRWCSKLGIKVKYSSPRHPQANGQVEATNKTIMGILKKKVGGKKGAWADELPEILWEYKTTLMTSTGETPFALAYGTKAMIPVEVGIPSHRKLNFDANENGKKLEEHLDLLEERRANAETRVVAYKRKTNQYFNKIVRPRSFKVSDLVLKETGGDHRRRMKVGPKMGGDICNHGQYSPGSLSPK